MSSRVSHLLGGLAPSATLAVDARAKALKAAGEPVIGYGAGEPDFATPVHIVEAAAKACYDPVNYKYTPTAGLLELREAIVRGDRVKSHVPLINDFRLSRLQIDSQYAKW